MNLGAGTVLDIIVLLIVLLSTIVGMKKGFVITIVSFLQWFVCMIIAFVFTSSVKEWLMENTPIDDILEKSIMGHFQSSVEDSAPYQAVPNLFSGLVKDTSEEIANEVAASITSMLMTVLTFAGIVLSIKLICYLTVKIFSKKNHDGPVGFFDGFLGFFVGLVRGIIYVFVFLALLVPVLALFMPDLSLTVIKGLDNSNIAGYMYENNFLLILVRDLFP